MSHRDASILTNYIFNIFDREFPDIIVCKVCEVLHPKHHGSFAETIPLLLREELEIVPDGFGAVEEIFETHLFLFKYLNLSQLID